MCYSVLAAIVYYVWKARHSALWDSKVPRPSSVIKVIKVEVCIRIRAFVSAKWSNKESEWTEKLINTYNTL